MGNDKVVIEIIASNSRTYNMLEFVLQQHGKGRFELGRGNRPDLVVVDFDNTDVKAAFRKYRIRFPKIPAVLLLNVQAEYETLCEEDRIGAEFLLLKPFAAKDFIAKINECLDGVAAHAARTDADRSAPSKGKQASLAQAKSIATLSAPSGNKPSLEPHRSKVAKPETTLPLHASATGNQAVWPAARQRSWEALESEDIAYSFAIESDIDMSDAAAVKKIWLRIDDKLLGYFNSVISQQKTARSAICLCVHDSLSFHISAYAQTVVVVGDKFDLLELARQDFGSGKIAVSQSAMPDKNIQLQLGLEAFLWKLALYTYRGHLPEGMEVDKPVYLKYWPNLTRLEHTPNAMRIASLLSRQPVALAFIVRILNIPQSHVFNFFAAANAAGYSGLAVREADNMLLPSYPDELGDIPVQGNIGHSPSGNTNAK